MTAGSGCEVSGVVADQYLHIAGAVDDDVGDAAGAGMSVERAFDTIAGLAQRNDQVFSGHGVSAQARVVGRPAERGAHCSSRCDRRLNRA